MPESAELLAGVMRPESAPEGLQAAEGPPLHGARMKHGAGQPEQPPNDLHHPYISVALQATLLPSPQAASSGFWMA